jgi:Ca-activated chloride channel family protein
MSRGGIPAGARELVGDLGSRYSPEIQVPARQALSARVDLERAALPPSGGQTHLRIALRSRGGAPAERPPMSVHVVLDVSGSMQGDPIAQAKQAVVALVGRLEARDRFSLTTFSSAAQVLVGDGPVGPRRRTILDRVTSIEAQGGTNISAGLDLGYGESRGGPSSPEWVRIVMLLSDGRPNAGVVGAEGLGGRAALAFQDGIQTSAFGIGSEFDPAIMSAVAESGAGGYYYLRDGSSIAAALGAELDSRLQPVAQAVEVRVRLRPDIRLVQTYGSRRLGEGEAAAVRAQETAVDRQAARRDRIAEDRQEDLQGGMRFFIPGFSPDDRHVILLGIEVPGGIGERPVATVELRYKDRVARRNVIDETPVRVRFASSDAESVATLDASVARTVQGFDAGEALLSAARQIDLGDRASAVAVLAERAELLRQAAGSLGEPRFRQDAGRIDRFRSLIGGGGELSQPLVLALLLQTSGKGLLH